MPGLADLDAVELRRLLDVGETSATEVMEAHLARIETVNDRLNAIVTLDLEHALASARRADAASRAQPRGRLFGLPIAVKDLVDTAGMRTTYGSPIYRDHVPTVDAPLVQRLRAADAIIIGKTNTPEYGAGSQTFNQVFGPTRNPYDPARTVGGSSGGAAAAVAAGMVPVADGSDLGGSLRNPASFCNVVGFRTTPGLVPRDSSDRWDPLSVYGPIGRTVADAALLLAALAEPDARAPLGFGRLSGKVAEIPLQGLRIAWSPNLGDLPIEPSVVAALERGLAGLERHGCTIEPAEPELAGVDEAFEVLRALTYVRDYADDLAAHPTLVKETVAWNIAEGLAMDGARIVAAQRRRSEIFRSFAAFLEDYDAFALPAAAVLPFPVETEWVREIAGVRCETYIEWMRVCTRISVTAHPAISIPFAFSENGLPIGLQLVGRYREDDRLLSLAAAIERATDASARKPPLGDRGSWV